MSTNQDSSLVPPLSDAEKNELHLQQLASRQKSDFVSLGLLLYENHKEAYWSLCGHESFKDLIETLGVGSYSYVTRLMQAARLMIDKVLTEDEILEIGVAKVSLLLPRAKDGTLTRDDIELAKSAPYRDLRGHLGYKADDRDMGSSITCPRCGAEINNAKWVKGGRDES